MGASLTEAEELVALSHDLQQAMGQVNDAAAKLTGLGYTVRLFGWTSPGMRGNVRCQGNSTVQIDDQS